MAEEIIVRKRDSTKKGGFSEIVAWKVPVSDSYPEGIKYSFTYIKDEKRILAIDNYNSEGHHIHIEDMKFPFDFIDLETTRKIFKRLVEIIENVEN